MHIVVFLHRLHCGRKKEKKKSIRKKTESSNSPEDGLDPFEGIRLAIE